MSSTTTNPNSTPPSGHHRALILPSPGHPLTLTHLPTSTPGPTDLLIAVHSLALNPIDHFQRATGIFLQTSPAVLGSDLAGTVLAAGASVPSSGPKPGTRVAAFAPCFFTGGKVECGAFQEKVLVPAENAVVLPEGVGWNEAATLPMAVLTAWSGWCSVGLPREMRWRAGEGQGVLVWGGASSVGSAAVQVAKLMGFRVYATASERHHEWLKGLGASRVFDYHATEVVGRIVGAAREDGVVVRYGFDAVGQLKDCLEVLSELKGEGIARLASAVPLAGDAPTVEGVEVKFVAAPEGEERAEHFRFVFGVWLKEKLETGEFVPSPKAQVVEGGLESVNEGLDILKKGVSGVKLVLEV